MDYLNLLKQQFNNHISFREKRLGTNQLILPLYYEDGDMVDIFLEDSSEKNTEVRICDHGMALMRLSYSFDLNTSKKEEIFQRILSENNVSEENGNLFMEVKPKSLYPAILQFAQTLAKVSNMQLYKREIIHSLFFEFLTDFIEDKLRKYNPRPNIFPIPDRDDLEVDFQFDIKPHPLYLFGVKDNTKARLASISCLEFQRAKLPFKSYIVHEDFDNLSKKDRRRVTSAADKQFVSLDDFKEHVIQVLERDAA